jgi:Na+/H+-dicarboxylate symporter
MEKLELAGCSKPVVGLVVPTGYVFNTDGTSIYMTLEPEGRPARLDCGCGLG